MKVLLIGVDGGELSIVRKGIEKGVLPTFDCITRHGVCGELASTIPPSTAPAWVSMVTGVNPGKHGIFDFVDWRTGRLFNSSDVMSPTLWEVIGGHDKKSILINVPFTYPPKRIDGAIVPGIPLPSALKPYPSNIKSLLDEERYVPDFGEYDALKYIILKREARLLEEVGKITEKRTTVALRIMRSMDWDLLMIVYTTLDRVQHVAFHKPEVVLEAYRRVDNNIRRLLDEVDEETAILLASDHGFQPAVRVLYINEVLRRAGLIKFPRRKLLGLMAYQELLHWMSKGWLRTPVGKIFELVAGEPKWLIDALKFSRGEGVISEAQAKAVSAYGPYCYLHADNEGTRTKLALISTNLRGCGSHDRIIEAVIPTRSLYDGDFVSRAPELILKCRAGYSIYTLVGTPKVTVDVNECPEPTTGAHRRRGMLLAFGKNVRDGKSDAIYASIYDVAPTVLALLDLHVPRWFDGKPIANILSLFGKKRPRSYTDEKDRILYIIERLRGRLGSHVCDQRVQGPK